MINNELRSIFENLENNLVIDTKSNCQICGSHLELSHKTNFIACRVEESSRCLKCGIVLKNKSHTLH